MPKIKRKQQQKKCELDYKHDPTTETTTLECTDGCDQLWECDLTTKKCTRVDLECKPIVNVKFNKGKFVPDGKTLRCACVIAGKDKKCQYKVEVDPKNPKVIKSAKCEGECPHYYKDAECKNVAGIQCVMVWDVLAKKVTCVCERFK